VDKWIKEYLHGLTFILVVLARVSIQSGTVSRNAIFLTIEERIELIEPKSEEPNGMRAALEKFLKMLSGNSHVKN